MILNRLKIEPAVITGLVQTVLALLLAFKILKFTDEQTGLILAFVAAGCSLVLALQVRPLALPVVTGALTAGFALLLGFQFDVDQGKQAAILAAVTLVVGFLNRTFVTPEQKLPPIVVAPAVG